MSIWLDAIKTEAVTKAHDSAIRYIESSKFASRIDVQGICMYYIAQHNLLTQARMHTIMALTSERVSQERDCTADHCPLLHCRKDEERTAPKIL